MTFEDLKSLISNQDVRVETYVDFDTQEEMIEWKHQFELKGEMS